MTDQAYWDKAALDPAVDEKYIADIDTLLCVKALAPALGGNTILEIGSGVGRLSIPVSKRSEKSVTGVDISPAMRRIARARAEEAGVRRCYFLSPEGFYGLPDAVFDSAYSMLTFQHINPVGVQRYIKEIARQLKPGGVFRFQFVSGSYHAPQDHNYKTEQMLEWLMSAGFTVANVDDGLLHPQWTWITAVRVP